MVLLHQVEEECFDLDLTLGRRRGKGAWPVVEMVGRVVLMMMMVGVVGRLSLVGVRVGVMRRRVRGRPRRVRARSPGGGAVRSEAAVVLRRSVEGGGVEDVRLLLEGRAVGLSHDGVVHGRHGLREEVDRRGR